MPPPTMLLLPRLGLVAGGAKPPNTFNYSLGPDRGRGRHSSSSPSRISSSKISRRFSCNAEQPNGAGTRSRRWWSDEAQFDEDYDDEFDDEEEDASFGSAREMFDEPWFTKALRAYGYVLPLILVSMLVATGPQAFLMAMAIPLAQSAVSFAVRAFSSTFGRRNQEEYDDDYYPDYRNSGWEEEEPEREEYSSTRYKDSSSSSRSQQRQQPRAKDGKSKDSEPKGEPDDIDSATESGRSAGFGGWDELDSGDDYYRSRSSSSRRSAGPSLEADTATAAKTATGGASGSVRRRPQPEATTRRRRSRAAARYRQSPLFMRLLVALFPFLGSWFRIML